MVPATEELIPADFAVDLRQEKTLPGGGKRKPCQGDDRVFVGFERGGDVALV